MRQIVLFALAALTLPLSSCRLFFDGAACNPDNPATCPDGTVCSANGTCVVAEDPCGNGVVGDGEECDDGNAENRDGCHNDCKLPRCGDGFSDVGEGCDDGNAIDTDACSNACALTGLPPAFCGDGAQNGDEDCDFAVVDEQDCTPTCVRNRCGDGFVAGTEQCDTNDAGCVDCAIVGGPGEPVCGDGVKNGSEECDFAAAGTTNCTQECKNNVCGDGFVVGAEECDDGDDDRGEGDSCDAGAGASCTFSFCGDGRTSNGEVCDFANAADPNFAACRRDCSIISTTDGIVDAGEQCDDGNDVDADGCTDNVIDFCGDGIVNNGESCDFAAAGPPCRPDCTLICGDGVINDGEECDGTANCNATCQIAASCSEILAAHPGSPSGTYAIRPNGTLRNVTCDMAFDGGGWTLVMATAALGPDNVPLTNSALTGQATRLSVSDVAALARRGGQVHVRAEGLANSRSLTSRPNSAPIARLALGAALSPMSQAGDGLSAVFNGSSEWTGPLASHTDGQACSPRQGFPSVLHVCGVGDGVHVTGDTSALTSSSSADNERVEIYVRDLARCGDGVLAAGEECDDGNGVDGDGCSPSCTLTCGDGDTDRVVTLANPAVSPTGDLTNNRMRSMLGTGDLNGDARPDLVMVQLGTGRSRLAVAVSSPRGLQPAQALVEGSATTGSSSPPAIADVTGDGKLDVVAFRTTGFSCEFDVYAGNGVGGVANAVPSPTRFGDCRGGAVYDIDGDGDLDVVMPGFGASALFVAQNNGRGGFTTGSDIAIANCTPHAAGVGDFDGDRVDDLVVGCTVAGQPALRLFTRTGNTLSAPVSVGPNGGAFILAVGDVDSDGRDDIVTTVNDNAVIVRGAASLAQAAVAFTLPLPGGEGAAIGDVDGDGDNDVVMGKAFTAATGDVLLRNVTRPGKTLNFHPEAAPLSVEAGTPSLVDLNGDGVLDFVSVNQGTDQIIGSIDSFVVETCDDGNDVATDGCDFCQVRCSGAQSTDLCFVDAGNIAAAGGIAGFVDVDDYDNDGVDDVMVGNFGFGGQKSINLLRSNVRSGAVSNTAIAVVSEPQGQAAGDIDEDGIVDFLSVDTGDAAIPIHFGRQGGTFAQQGDADLGFLANVSENGSPFINGVDLADLDGDGHQDAMSFSSRMRVHYGDGTRNTAAWPFVTVVQNVDGQNLVSHALGDFDGDGDVDVAAIALTINELSVFRNNAPARTFTKVRTQSLTGAVTAGDVDNDGALDLVIGGSASGLVVMRNNGSGTFADPVQLAPTQMPASALPVRGVVGDVDGDGFNDVVVSHGGATAGVTVLFGSAAFADLGVRHADIVSGVSDGLGLPDLDGDGDLDVVVCGDGDHIRVFEQR